MKLFKSGFWGYLAAAVFVLIVWQIAAVRLATPMLPSPKDAFEATGRLLEVKLSHHLWVSTFRVIISILLALFLALPLGLIMGYERKFSYTLT